MTSETTAGGARRDPVAAPERAGSPAGAPGSPGAVVAASALVVSLALAAGLRPDQYWLTGLLVAAAMAQGLLAGATWRRFWRGPAREAIFGAGGRYVGFLAAVAFSAVEAYAVGAGIGRESAPGPVISIMLAPPLLLAAFALRSAVRHRDAAPPGTHGGKRGPRTGTLETSEDPRS